MINLEQEQTIRCLHKQGMSLRQISVVVGVSRNTVRRVIVPRKAMAVNSDSSADAPTGSKNGNTVPKALVQELFERCQGNVSRLQELLKTQYQQSMSYSTLTRWVREAQLRPVKPRSGHYDFGPGEEMEHDTSPHRLQLKDKKLTAQCASLTFAYSRKVFFQYYPRFTRLEAKAFLVQAVTFMAGACQRCIIDNTSVILASGSGNDAVIAPEMSALSRAYGFTFKAHAIGHSDRKAHVERNFHYIENNFLVAREFNDWADLNQQAIAWCQNVANHKNKRSLNMSPNAAALIEAPHLQPLPAYRLPIHDTLHRQVSVDAFVHVDTNRYSAPEKLIGKMMEVHKHLETIVIYFNRKEVATHSRIIGKRNKQQTLPGHHQPLNKRRGHRGPSVEEQDMAGYSIVLDAYIGKIKQRCTNRATLPLRRLLKLKRRYPASAFNKALIEAEQYGMYDMTRLENMILERVCGDFFNLDDE